MDTSKLLDNAYEFYEIGMGEPMIVSAEQALGIGDLLDRVVAYFPEEKNTENDDEIVRVAFIGKPNAGKSSLINYILGEERLIVTDIPGTTRDSIDSYFTYNDNKYVFVDTAGLRRKRSIYENIERYSVVRTLTAIDRADICVLVVDGTEELLSKIRR